VRGGEENGPAQALQGQLAKPQEEEGRGGGQGGGQGAGPVLLRSQRSAHSLLDFPTRTGLKI